MSKFTGAVLAPPDYAKDLGKKGTISDITFYFLKKGDATVTFIEPDTVPGKIIIAVLCGIHCGSCGSGS